MIIISCANLHAQSKRLTANGSLLIQNYPPKIINGNAQVFDITQSESGLMYFANQQGVLEYDGNTWRKIAIDDGYKALCLVTLKNGEIYVGGEKAFGKLSTNSAGSIYYESLKNVLSPDQSDIGTINKISQYEDKIIVQSELQLYVLRNDSLINEIKPEFLISSHFIVENTLFVVLKDRGLYYFKNNELIQFEGGYEFANKDISMMGVFDNKRIVLTESSGIFQIDEYDQFVKIEILNGVPLTNAVSINDELLAVGTFSDGIVVLDKSFKIVYEIGLEKGLSDGFIKELYQDKESNLWLATNRGVSKVEIQSPIITFDKSAGLKSGIESVVKFDNELYIAALDGLYKLDQNGVIAKQDFITADCYNLQVLPYLNDSVLFISELRDLIGLDREGNNFEFSKGGPYQIEASPFDKNEYVVLHYNGIVNVKVDEEGDLSSDRFIDNFISASTDIFNFILLDDGTMYIGTQPNDGIYKTHIDVFRDSTIEFKHYYSDHNLEVGATYLFYYDNTVFVGSDSGLFYLKDDKFYPSNHFGIDFSKQKFGVHRISEDPQGRIWMVLFDELNNFQYGFAQKNKQGLFEWSSKQFMRHAEEIVHGIYHENNHVTWLGGTSGLLRYDERASQNYNTPYKALIRSVSIGQELLFGGSPKAKISKVELEYNSTQSINFEFSATSYIDESNTEYSYILEGYSNSWSEWGKFNLKEYNLQEGTYTFKVKARNVYGVESEEASFTFTILPPWYRTTWAYVLYILGLIMLIYLVVRFSLVRVKKQNQRLEETVKERTAEIVAQKEEVEIQKEIVEEKNKDIMDSIRYAKHIQDAILPSDEFVGETFNDAFILFKPKDIVSGDFYWVKEKGNLALFAAVDCTGHGVPGAFVSIVGNNGLNRAINEFGLLDPGKILDKLTLLVEEAFKQQGASDTDDVKDGMDIALCVLNKDSKELRYAGANNPLYLIRQGELIEVKADKQPIGSYENRVPFRTHTIQLEKNDRIFLFSDGYADQFGGPKGKKFKYKTFKTLLLENTDIPISQFKQLLDDAFEEWKSDLEQIDDVCVMGIEI